MIKKDFENFNSRCEINLYPAVEIFKVNFDQLFWVPYCFFFMIITASSLAFSKWSPIYLAELSKTLSQYEITFFFGDVESSLFLFFVVVPEVEGVFKLDEPDDPAVIMAENERKWLLTKLYANLIFIFV